MRQRWHANTGDAYVSSVCVHASAYYLSSTWNGPKRPSGVRALYQSPATVLKRDRHRLQVTMCRLLANCEQVPHLKPD